MGASNDGLAASNSKPPRLLGTVITSYVTSTISTSTICYVSASPAPPTGITVCSKKKRRNLDSFNDVFNAEEEMFPSGVVAGLSPDLDLQSERTGRFLDYWLTTTFTSTQTSITKTLTLQSVYCTPPGGML